MEALPAVLALFGQSFLIALSGALMPGPLLTVTISEALGRGSRAGPFLVLGHGIAELALVTAAAAGLGVLLSRDVVIGGIGVVGGLVLIWMGSTMGLGSTKAAQQAISLLDKSDSPPQDRSVGSGLLRCISLGATTSIVNPYWIFWWVTIGLNLVITALKIGPFALVAFYIGHILADLGWYWGVAFTVSHGSHWLNAKAYRIILVVCAILLLGMGARFAIVGSAKLLSLSKGQKTSFADYRYVFRSMARPKRPPWRSLRDLATFNVYLKRNRGDERSTLNENTAVIKILTAKGEYNEFL